MNVQAYIDFPVFYRSSGGTRLSALLWKMNQIALPLISNNLKMGRAQFCVRTMKQVTAAVHSCSDYLFCDYLLDVMYKSIRTMSLTKEKYPGCILGLISMAFGKSMDRKGINLIDTSQAESSEAS